MAPVRGGVEQHVLGPALDAALQDRLQGLVAGIGAVEAQVVAEQQAAPLALAQPLQQARQAGDVLAVDLDQGQGGMPGLGRAVVDLGVHRLDQGALAHAAGAPEQGVVGRQAFGEAAGVLQQGRLLALDALQQPDLDPVDPGHRLQEVALGVPDEGIGGVERGQGRGQGCQALEGVGNAPQQQGKVLGRRPAHPSSPVTRSAPEPALRGCRSLSAARQGVNAAP